MAQKNMPPNDPGEDLVKKELISRGDLIKAKEHEARSGTPWYKQLLQKNAIPFAVIDEVLRYQFHSPAVRAQHETLGHALVASGDLSEDNLKKALGEQRRTGRLLGNILLRNGYVSPELLARALGKQYGMEFAALEKTPSDAHALEAVPESMACENEVLPITLEGDRLSVLVTGPEALRRLKKMGLMLGIRIHAIITACDDIEAEIEQRYESARRNSGESGTRPPAASPRRNNDEQRIITPEIQHENDAIKERTIPMATETPVPNSSPKESSRFQEIAQQAAGTSVIKMVNTIIEGAVNAGATDIHLDPQEPEMRVRYRIDGILHDVMSIPPNIEMAVISRIKIISEMDITETRRPQDGHISLEIRERDLDVRVATLPTFLGERVVLRLLDQSAVLQGIKDLGLEPDDEATLGRSIDQPYGMILASGPTGSGKTTTLYAALNQKNVMTDSIVTLEDPVEYQLSGINQVQIEPDIDMTFANVLRAALRQDIDVLLVGEIRDMETARIAVRAAMTGHLVFSTLHTNDAPEAISTLRNMNVPSYLISSALTAVVGQRLVRTICPECKAAFKPTQALLKSIQLPTTTQKLYRGVGCEKCYNTGNRGRTGVFEILEISPEVRRLIAGEESTEKIAKAAKLKTMAARSRQKLKNGIISPEEFLRVIRT